MYIYEKVRVYIDDNGIDQGAVAQKAGISAEAFKAILNGSRTLHAEDLKAICEALHVSSTTFIEIQSA